jgi:hypothetical protein
MRAGWMVAVAASALLGGCQYDPYTGTYVPCCSYYGYPYGYPYQPPVYAYPPGYGAPPAGYGAPPPGYSAPPAGYSGPPAGYGGPPPGYGGPPGGGNALAQQFAAANVTHNGQLTQAQAAVGGLQIVANNFNSIDLDHKGYVTLPEIQAWLAEQQGRGG